MISLIAIIIIIIRSSPCDLAYIVGHVSVPRSIPLSLSILWNSNLACAIVLLLLLLLSSQRLRDSQALVTAV